MRSSAAQAKRPGHAHEAHEAGSGPPRAASGASPAILIAEDDDSLRTMLELVLRREGYAVVSCSDGVRAQAALAEAAQGATALDAVLLDLRMPGASGAEILSSIRAEPRLRGLPVIAMSGYSDSLQAQQARSAGADAFLAKPFSIDQLTQMLRSLLERGSSA